ncbi:response regulator [Methylobacterium platani]|uniref:Transcriptional regulator n=1 Tax=Methylobacterium platani TaxID=427683 RepID=A0A179RXV5_9HYPH|nr:response regulator [Methylobacterium platani]OAS12437.1 transcriptional regulator [Methylobacterium platani]
MTLLVGRRVLLVEDESLVAMLAEDMLLELGCEVVVAMRLDKALALARNEVFDLALLDVNLGDARSYPVADLLFERRTPFLFATGYGKQGLEEAYKAVPVLQKPYQPAPLEHLLTRLLIGGAQARKWGIGSSMSCVCHTPNGQPIRADHCR